MAEDRSEEGAVKNLGLGSGLEIEAKPGDCLLKLPLQLRAFKSA